MTPAHFHAAVLLLDIGLCPRPGRLTRSGAAGASGSLGRTGLHDGELVEPLWAEAFPVSSFRQTVPLEGESVTERTEVYLAYDDDAIYIGGPTRRSASDYQALKQFREPRTFDFFVYGKDIGTVVRTEEGHYEVDPDGDGPAEPFRVSNRDFSYRSLLGNTVLRWKWTSGSTMFFVWQQRRIDSITAHSPGAQPWVGTFDLRDLREMFTTAPDNIFMVKVNYWLNP